MIYGRTPLQETVLVGRRLLSRHYYGDGRWGWRLRNAREQREWGDWRVTKARPRLTSWAKSSAGKARKVHAIRYSLTAIHLPTGSTVYLTVWWCGSMAHSQPKVESHPTVVCAGCHARLFGETEVLMG